MKRDNSVPKLVELVVGGGRRGGGSQKEGCDKIYIASYNGIGYPRPGYRARNTNLPRVQPRMIHLPCDSSMSVQRPPPPANRFLVEHRPPSSNTDSKNSTIFAIRPTEMISSQSISRLFPIIAESTRESGESLHVNNAREKEKNDRLEFWKISGVVGGMDRPFLAVNVLSPGTMEGLIASRSGEKSSRK